MIFGVSTLGQRFVVIRFVGRPGIDGRAVRSWEEAEALSMNIRLQHGYTPGRYSRGFYL